MIIVIMILLKGHYDTHITDKYTWKIWNRCAYFGYGKVSFRCKYISASMLCYLWLVGSAIWVWGWK